MPRYRRAKVEGGVFFFTMALADRSSDLLVRHIDRLRRVYTSVRERYPFETIAICVLPDHLHAIWSLPQGDTNFPLRWNLIKSGFSRGLPADTQRSSSKIARREKGIWQRRYWEHTIRDDADLARHVDYIHFNPVKHGGMIGRPRGHASLCPPYDGDYPSARNGRVINVSVASSTLTRPARMSTTALAIGMSIPFAFAISTSTGAVKMPSASAPPACAGSPRPSAMP